LLTHSSNESEAPIGGTDAVPHPLCWPLLGGRERAKAFDQEVFALLKEERLADHPRMFGSGEGMGINA
jgi:hypothetical protein